MALSEQLTKLADSWRSSRLVPRKPRPARKRPGDETRADLEQDIDSARASAQAQADRLRAAAEESKGDISAWWTACRRPGTSARPTCGSTWRARGRARRARGREKSRHRRGGRDVRNRLRLRGGGEAEHAVLDAALARMEADEAAARVGANAEAKPIENANSRRAGRLRRRRLARPRYSNCTGGTLHVEGRQPSGDRDPERGTESFRVSAREERDRIAMLRSRGQFFWLDISLSETRLSDLGKALDLPERALQPLSVRTAHRGSQQASTPNGSTSPSHTTATSSPTRSQATPPTDALRPGEHTRQRY